MGVCGSVPRVLVAHARSRSTCASSYRSSRYKTQPRSASGSAAVQAAVGSRRGFASCVASGVPQQQPTNENRTTNWSSRSLLSSLPANRHHQSSASSVFRFRLAFPCLPLGTEMPPAGQAHFLHSKANELKEFTIFLACKSAPPIIGTLGVSFPPSRFRSSSIAPPAATTTSTTTSFFSCCCSFSFFVARASPPLCVCAPLHLSIKCCVARCCRWR